MSPLAFMGAGWVILFSGWQTYSTLVVAILIGYALIAITYVFKLNPKAPPIDWRAAYWIIPWIIGMGLICYFSSFGPGGILGGGGVFKNVLDLGGTDPSNLGPNGSVFDPIVFSGLWSLVIYYLAVHLRLSEADVDKYVADVYPPPIAE
jgi:hypothetical protein